MTSSTNHIVGKISINLRASHQSGLYTLMNRISKAAQEGVEQSLDQWWSEHPETGLVRIDKVEIDATLEWLNDNSMLNWRGEKFAKELWKTVWHKEKRK